MEKEQHRGSDIDNQIGGMNKDQLTAEVARLKHESTNLREDLKTARSDWEAARKEEKLLREEIKKYKQGGGILDESTLGHKMELQTQRHNLEIQKLQLEIQKTKDEKSRASEDLTFKKTELEKLKLEVEKYKAEIAELKNKLDKIGKENDEKMLQLKTDAERNYFEAERQKIEAASHKRKFDDMYSKLEEMTRNQGYYQRQIAELEAMNQNLNMRVSMSDPQFRMQPIRSSNLGPINPAPMFSSAYGDLSGSNQATVPVRSSSRVPSFD